MGTTGQSITLANSIIGVGVLAMPFCFQQCGVLLATLILLLMGLVSRLCCYFLLKSALIAKKRNFEYLAFHVFGSTGKLAVEVGIVGFLMGTCIAYFVVVGDLGPQIIAKMFNINQSDMLRTCIMVIVSVVCVLPLGLLRNVDSLSNVSAATIGFYFCLVLKVIIEATSQMSNEWPSQVEMWKPSGVLQCVPIFSMALFCQTQLFEIFESMPSLSLEKMNVVTKNAINICTGVYFTLGLFGYIAFSSQNISGNILMSLSPTMASDVIKLGFVMSVAFSFPLIIFPCRASLYSFLFKKVHLFHHDHIVNNSIPEGTFRCITVAIIAGSLLVSLMLPNIELVLGLVGSTIGVMICVFFPAACFINITFKNTNERVLAKGIMALGLVIMVLGTYANLQAAEIKLDRYDDKFTQERIDKIVEDFFESKKFKKVEEFDALPQPEKESIKLNDDIKINKEPVIKDSEVQPPNPVPPDSLSDEKIQRPVMEKNNDKKDNPEVQKVNEKADVDRVLDSHPKNLKGKLIDEKLSNGAKNIENIDKPKDVKAAPSEQDKMDRIKQQQLIETIKQHGKEQKELIKEQKEILDEIIKTKKEMQQKKEVDSIEAKKIAVESIQKIANMAIQSISGVSEKPSQKKANINEKSKNIANEAVQEIAKKAVETLEAIKDEKVKQEPALISVIKGTAQSEDKHILQQNVHSDQKREEAEPKDSVPDKIMRRSNGVAIESVINKGEELVNQNIKSENSAFNADVNIKKPLANEVQSGSLQKSQDSTNLKTEIENEKVHSHLSDEPQSYKQGEDSQNVIVNPNPIKKDIILEVPDAGNSNTLNKDPIVQSSGVKTDVKVKSLQTIIDDKLVKVDKDVQINHRKESITKDLVMNLQSKEAAQDKLLVRQKREVVDCTEKASLKPEDKEICKTLLANPVVDSDEILPKVDFSNAGLPNNIPLYHIRSLKNFDETKEK